LVAGAGHEFFCPDGGDGDVQVEDVADGVNLERERERERESCVREVFNLFLVF
jgi:hypothetical protein